MIDEYKVLHGLGVNIRRHREFRGISQGELAQRVGTLGRTSITNIEAGKQNVDVFTLYVLAEELGVAPWLLLPRMAEVAPEAAGNAVALSQLHWLTNR